MFGRIGGLIEGVCKERGVGQRRQSVALSSDDKNISHPGTYRNTVGSIRSPNKVYCMNIIKVLLSRVRRIQEVTSAGGGSFFNCTILQFTYNSSHYKGITLEE